MQLKDAWYALAPIKWRDAYDRPPKNDAPPAIDLESVQKADRVEQFRLVFQNIGKSFSSYVESEKQRQEIRAHMEEMLLADLRSGALVALGFARKFGIESDPSVVPAHFFESDYAFWEESLFRRDDVEFVSVRVSRPRRFLVPLTTSSSATGAAGQAKIGRPTKRGDIITAINSLKSEGINFSNMSAKEARRIIVGKMDEIYPGRYLNYKGCGEETIRRIMRELKL